MTHSLLTGERLNFSELAPSVGTGAAPTPQWRTIAQAPLVILVGVTGVGKSTTLTALRTHGLVYQLLPDRRDLTDRLIITFLQKQAGRPVQPVTDRTERFALTRQYRTQFPGGMAHAVSQLLIQDAVAADAPTADSWWIFDGLRGANEVQAAVQLLPHARFVVLDAPDAVRVKRLLGRGDQFDQVALDAAAPTTAAPQTFAAIGVPEAVDLFTAAEQSALLALCAPPVGHGDVPVDELRKRLVIVSEERRNYDPGAAVAVLQAQAPARTLVIDTTAVDPVGAALQIINWLSFQQS
jgi:hypothetical protein